MTTVRPRVKLTPTSFSASLSVRKNGRFVRSWGYLWVWRSLLP